MKLKNVAITGNLCVNRGITINSEKMLITHSILPPNILKPSSAYQLAGRICGNIKQFKNYVSPTIYCTSEMKEKIINMEETAKSLALKIKNLKITDDKKTLEPLIKKFTSEQNAREFCKLINYKPQIKYPNKNGYYEASVLSSLKIFSCEEIHKYRNWGLNEESLQRFYPCYRDINDINTLEWWLIIYNNNYKVCKINGTRCININNKYFKYFNNELGDLFAFINNDKEIELYEGKKQDYVIKKSNNNNYILIENKLYTIKEGKPHKIFAVKDSNGKFNIVKE